MAVDQARLKANVEKKENCIRVVEVEVDPAELGERMDKLFAELTPTVLVPGFRPGRAPRKLVERKFHKTVRQEAVDKVVADSFETVCEMENLRPVAEPSIEDVSSEPEAPITFRVTVETAPVVELGEYKSLELDKRVRKITDEHVDDAIDELLASRAVMEPVEGRPARLDEMVVFDIEVMDDDRRVDEASGEGLNLWLDENPDLPDLHKLLLETEPGQEFEDDITFPENARVSVAGKQVHIRGTVKEVKQRVVPELNDEFANEVDPDFHTVEDLRAHTREIIESEAEKEADERLRRAAIDRVVDNSTFERPQSLVEQLAYENMREQTSRLLSRGVPEEVIRERQNEISEASRREAEHSMKVHAMLSTVADQEDIRVSDEDVDAEIGTIRDYGERMGWNLDRLDEHYAQSSSRESIQSRLTREKTIQFVVDNAEVKRVEVDTLIQDDADDDSTAKEDE